MAVELKIEVDVGISIDFNLLHHHAWHRSKNHDEFDPLWEISRDLLFTGKTCFENSSALTPMEPFFAMVYGILHRYKTLQENQNEIPMLTSFPLKKVVVIE